MNSRIYPIVARFDVYDENMLSIFTDFILSIHSKIIKVCK